MNHRIGPSYRLEFAIVAAILATLAWWARDDLGAWISTWSPAQATVRIECRAPVEGEHLYVTVRRDRAGRHVGDCYYATSRGAARQASK